MSNAANVRVESRAADLLAVPQVPTASIAAPFPCIVNVWPAAALSSDATSSNGGGSEGVSAASQCGGSGVTTDSSCSLACCDQEDCNLATRAQGCSALAGADRESPTSTEVPTSPLHSSKSNPAPLTDSFDMTSVAASTSRNSASGVGQSHCAPRRKIASTLSAALNSLKSVPLPNAPNGPRLSHLRTPNRSGADLAEAATATTTSGSVTSTRRAGQNSAGRIAAAAIAAASTLEGGAAVNRNPAPALQPVAPACLPPPHLGFAGIHPGAGGCRGKAAGGPAAAAAAAATTAAASRGSAAARAPAMAVAGGAEAEDAGSGSNSVSVSEVWDSLPAFSPGVVDRLWAGGASMGSDDSPPRYLRGPFLDRQQQQQQQQHGRQRGNGGVNAAAGGAVAAAGTAVATAAGGGGGRKRRTTDQGTKSRSSANEGPVIVPATVTPAAAVQVAVAAPVPCMSLVAAAAAAAAAPRALGFATCHAADGARAGVAAAGKRAGGGAGDSVCSSAGPTATSLTKAPATSSFVAATAAAAGISSPAGWATHTAPLQPVARPDVGTHTPASAFAAASAAAAAAVPAAFTSPVAPCRVAAYNCEGMDAASAAVVEAAARQLFAEPRGHVHNGPRMPLGNSGSSSGCGGGGASGAATLANPQPHAHARARAQALLTASVAAMGSANTVHSAVVAEGFGNGGGCGGVGGGDGGGSDPQVPGASPPDSPCSQASTVYEDPQLPSAFMLRQLERSRWPGAGGRVGRSGSSNDIRAGGGGDARTQWWDLTGRFDESANVEVRRSVFPYERQSPEYSRDSGSPQPRRAHRAHRGWWEVVFGGAR